MNVRSTIQHITSLTHLMTFGRPTWYSIRLIQRLRQHSASWRSVFILIPSTLQYRVHPVWSINNASALSPLERSVNYLQQTQFPFVHHLLNITCATLNSKAPTNLHRRKGVGSYYEEVSANATSLFLFLFSSFPSTLISACWIGRTGPMQRHIREEVLEGGLEPVDYIHHEVVLNCSFFLLWLFNTWFLTHLIPSQKSRKQRNDDSRDGEG